MTDSKTLSGLDDSALIAQVRRGNMKFFEPLMERYQRLVRICVWNYTKDPGAIDDLAQEAFTRALEHINQLRSPERFRPWLLQIAHRLCHDDFRKKTSITADISGLDYLGNGLLNGPPSPAGAIDEATIPHLLSLIEPFDAELLWLRFVEGCEYTELSEITGLQKAALRQRICRSLRRLREELP